MEPRPKDKWDKWDIILKPVGGLMTALSVALVGILGSQWLAAQQEDDANTRLYTELMSSRERADSALRQEMFDVIISTFLKANKDGQREVRDEILALELLAYNFHDAIDIGPLFNHVRAHIDEDLDSGSREYRTMMGRLQRVAREVTSKQLASFSDGGVTLSQVIVDFSQLENVLYLVDDKLPSPAPDELAAQDAGSAPVSSLPPRHFYLDALDVDEEKKTVHVNLTVMNESTPEIGADFDVGFYDFPMIDNSRLPGGQRVAVVLLNWEPSSHAELGLAYFPSSRASLKEKLYYEEIVEQLHLARRDDRDRATD